MKIGVISDTHGHLDSKIEGVFAGVDHILHGGDIGPASIILELEAIAPVTAVIGNTDSFLDFREVELVELGGRKFLVQHAVNPIRPDETLASRIRRQRPDAVVFGHTHKPFSERINGTLFFNPGYAGKQRFDLPRSVAILHCDERGIRHEFIPL